VKCERQQRMINDYCQKYTLLQECKTGEPEQNAMYGLQTTAGCSDEFGPLTNADV